MFVVVLGSPSIATAQRDAEAHGLYTAGAAAFATGRYDEALVYFQHAYELSHRPELLFNVGQAADRARHDDVALAAFRGYLDAVADIPDREEIEGRIRVLERAVAAHTAAPIAPAAPAATDTNHPDIAPPPMDVAPAPAPSARPPTPPIERTPSSDGPDVGAIVVTTAGGVLVVGGAILLGIGVPSVADYMPSETRDQYNARVATGDILLGVGATGIGLGLVGVIVGAVMLATQSRTSPGAALRVAPSAISIDF